MSARARAIADDAIYATTSGHVRVRPAQLGDRVRAHGVVGVVTAIDLSLATGHRIVTIESSPRVRLRIEERNVELLP